MARCGAAEERVGDRQVARAKALKFPDGSGFDGPALKKYYETKIALFETAISRNARHYEAHTGLADVYFNATIGTQYYRGKLTRRNLSGRDRMIAAFRALNQATRIDPTRPDAFEARARVVSYMAMFGIANFRSKLKQVARSASPHGSRKQPRIVWLRAAAKLDLAWARCYVLRALPDIKQLVQLQRSHPNEWAHYIGVLMYLRQVPEARAVRERALAIARAASPRTRGWRTATETMEQWQRYERASWYRTFAEWSKGPVPRMCLSGWRWPPWAKVSRNGKPASYGYPKFRRNAR
jgi:hypothetical protein